MKKILTTATFLTIIFFLTPLAIFSQTSSSEEYRLEQIEKLSATASAQTATSSAKKTATYSFIEGSVNSVSSAIIFLTTNNGIKTIYTSDSTKFYNFDASGKKLIGIGDLKAGDTLDIIGPSPLTNSASANIIVREQVSPTKNFALIGKVAEINATNLKLSSSVRNDLPAITSVLNSDTTAVVNNKVVKLTDILANNYVIVAGYFDEKNNLVSKEIFRIALSGKTLTSTPSAK